MQKEITAGNYKSMKSIHRNTILHSGHGKKHPIRCENRRNCVTSIYYSSTYILQFNIYVTVQHICYSSTYMLQFNIYVTVQHTCYSLTYMLQFNIYITVQHICYSSTYMFKIFQSFRLP